MRKIQNEKKKNFDTPKTILHNKRKIISLNLHPRTFQTDQFRSKNWNQGRQCCYQRQRFYSTFALFSSIFSSSKLLHNFHPTPLSISIRWFPGRATEVEVLACRRCSINLSLTRHLRDCVRAICYAREGGSRRSERYKSRASSQWNINGLLQNIRRRVIIVYMFRSFTFYPFKNIRLFEKDWITEKSIFLFFLTMKKIPISGNLFATSQIFLDQQFVSFLCTFFRPSLYDN